MSGASKKNDDIFSTHFCLCDTPKKTHDVFWLINWLIFQIKKKVEDQYAVLKVRQNVTFAVCEKDWKVQINFPLLLPGVGTGLSTQQAIWPGFKPQQKQYWSLLHFTNFIPVNQLFFVNYSPESGHWRSHSWRKQVPLGNEWGCHGNRKISRRHQKVWYRCCQTGKGA